MDFRRFARNMTHQWMKAPMKSIEENLVSLLTFIAMNICLYG